MSALSKLLRNITLVFAMGATLNLAGTADVDARPHGGFKMHHGGKWHGGHHYGHWRHHQRGCWDCWAGGAFIGGLALGALASPYYYPSTYAGYGECWIERRVRYTAYGPVVRRVRVCI